MVKVVVIIPAYNEESSIGLVLKDIPRNAVDEIVVVNNNSSDNTAEVARSNGATVINEMNMGYGNACLCGIKYISRLDPKPDIVVFLDGDYSDYPGEIEKIISPIALGNYDLVIGSRTAGKREKGALLPQAVIGNFIATSLIRIFYKVKFTDLGPFRAIKYEKLISLGMEDKTFGWTVEMQIKAAKNGLKCTEVPVSYRKRVGVSKITGTVYGTIMASYKIIWTIFKYL